MYPIFGSARICALRVESVAKNSVDFLMHQNHMSQLPLIHNVIHPNDLNILLLMDVVLNNVALSKFPLQDFHEIL